MSEKLIIVIDAKDQASGVIKGLATSVRGELKGIEGATGAMGATTGSNFDRMGAFAQKYEGQIRAVSVGLVALGAVTVGVAAKCIAGYQEEVTAVAKLSSAIAGTAQAIDKSRLVKLAGDLQKVSTFTDDSIITMEAMLTTFNLTQDQIEQLAPRILNIAAIMGTDLQSAAVAVGKAISTNNYGALTRFGIIIDEDTQKSGNFVDVLKAIDRNTGPAAKGTSDAAGAAEELRDAVDDLQDSIGAALLPSMQGLAAIATPVAKGLNAIAESPVGKVLVAVGTGGVIAAGGLGMIGLAVPNIIRGIAAIRGALVWLGVTSKATATQVSADAARMAAATTAAGETAAGGGLRRLLTGAGLRGMATRAGPYALGAGAAYSLYNAPRLGEQSASRTHATGLSGLRQRLGLLTSAEYAALEGGAAPESPDDMATWRSQMQTKWGGPQAGAIAQPAAAIAALEPELIEPMAELVGAAPARSVAGMTEVGPGAWLLPGAGQASRPRTPVSVRAEGVDVSESFGAGGREIVIRVLVPSDSPGITDDRISDWMDDLQYAAASP